MTGLELGYEEGRAITAREAKNFYYAMLTLPAERRRAIYVAYAFCRHSDDAVDAATSTEEKLARLDHLRTRLDGAYAGQADEPLFIALADVAGEYDIPGEYFHEVLRGMERDLVQQRYRDFEDLREYCYQAASVVGLICIQIFGYTEKSAPYRQAGPHAVDGPGPGEAEAGWERETKFPAARNHAIDLGLAMQLTNIIRDVGEDFEMGRIYLPQDEMSRFGYTEDDLSRGVVNEAFVSLMQFQAERARSYFKSGFKLLPYLSPRSRACPAIFGQVYSKLLERIEASGFDVLRQRIALSKAVKLRLMAQTWLSSVRPMRVR